MEGPIDNEGRRTAHRIACNEKFCLSKSSDELLACEHLNCLNDSLVASDLKGYASAVRSVEHPQKQSLEALLVRGVEPLREWCERLLDL